MMSFMHFEQIEERWGRMAQGDVAPNEMLRILGLAMDDMATLIALVKELRDDQARLEERNAQLRSRVQGEVGAER